MADREDRRPRRFRGITREQATILAQAGVSSARINALLRGFIALSDNELAILEGDFEAILAQRRARGQTSTMRVYTIFDQEDDIVTDVTRRVTEGMWTGNTGTLTTFFTSSVQSGSTGNWYYDVYNADPAVDSTAEVQFAVSYGHRLGFGAPRISDVATAKLPTDAVYSQYRNLLLQPDDNTFTFAGSVNSDDIYVINMQRARMKQKMDAGNWEITFSGSNGYLTFIDDSENKNDTVTSGGGRVYNVVSGALNIGSTSEINQTQESGSGGYGLFYPDRGIIILNPAVLIILSSVYSLKWNKCCSPFGL
ncbi:hypothetical protein LCGC14_3031950 [marine sediment metagenome]|uniref:Uncharacterized protein n=1 Tax=marine sediment metagenome TaxID=412755 RepID=A0A0F8WRW7_9ZZZZ